MSNPGFWVASCQHCGQHIEFPIDGQGMEVACPHCTLETILVEDLALVQNAAEEITAGELKAALSGPVPRRPISVFYQIGLVLVAIFMILLPLVYVAFIALVAYGTYWYADHARVLLSGFTGGARVYILKVIIYIGPVLGGGISFFFMLKPIFAPRGRQANPVELNPGEHQRLYQFIANMCEVLRVSMPKRIYLNCELNASAGFRRGWFSMLGNDLVLTLGLPLVAGLDTRQLAAVVAHELGHCTQGFAMRVGYVIHHIDRWFFRVVYERDAWDEMVREWQNSAEDSKLGLVVLIIVFAVWTSRMVLKTLMLAGHVVSCFLSRQMEYHADRCAMEVAGSAAVESLLVRLREQAILEKIARTNLGGIWKQRRQLPDSLPDFYEQLEQRLPAGFHEQARMTLINETGSWFATHPTAAQRIKNARQRDIPGIFAIEKPARVLFKDFIRPSMQVTAAHYRQDLRLPVTDPMLKPAIEFFEETQKTSRRIPIG